MLCDIGYQFLPGVLSLCDYAKPTSETMKLANGAKEQASCIVNMCELYRSSIVRDTKRRDATIKRISAARNLIIQVLMMTEDSFAAANLPLSIR